MRRESIIQIRETIISWGIENYQEFPWRSASTPWHGLIAEILLQRTRAKSVTPVFIDFCKKFPEPIDLANASISDIEKCIFPLGLKWRALLLQKLGKELSVSNGVIPEDYSSLILLPGVGDYVASAWLSFHGSNRGILIDANVVRFFCKLENVEKDGETRRKKWVRELSEEITPQVNWRDFNFSILDFTMIICGNKPNCHECPIEKGICLFKEMKGGK
jgi:A/G-specific adenine glycosylase